MENLMAGVGRKFVNTTSGGITPIKEFKKINTILDKDLLSRSCPCCGSPNLNKDRFNYVCFRCGTSIGVDKC
jgi:hypothetical protein